MKQKIASNETQPTKQREENVDTLNQVIIVGGGLAGLTNAIHLSQKGVRVSLVERHVYPKHKVCGEYISNEVLPYLSYLGIDPLSAGAVDISRFELSTVDGKLIKAQLPLGGFGISRYALDELLYKRALSQGVTVIQDTVTQIAYDDVEDRFTVSRKNGGHIIGHLVIGAYGKRSNLDVSLGRSFIKERSPYLGVKCHYSGDFPSDVVALHNFAGGYCGVSKVENDVINFCYLADYATFKTYKSIQDFQQNILCKNPHLKEILASSRPLFESPISISQVSFLPKPTVEQHVLMSGDSAGMIHPLCGNGMSMAIHSALLLSEAILQYLDGPIKDRQMLEAEYNKRWRKTFRKRLLAGRFFNSLFGKDSSLQLGMKALSYAPFLLPYFIKQTHGEPLMVGGHR